MQKTKEVSSGPGLLAIWSTIDSERETDYVHWLTREHVFERIGVQGFRSGRVFKRLDSHPSEYLILYELDDAEVMASEDYLRRLNDPTPWTKKIMPTLQRFRRGGGEIVAQGGNPAGQGSAIALARFDNALPDHLVGSERDAAVHAIATLDGIVNARVMAVRTDATAIPTQEKSMRQSSEGTFSGMLMIESCDARYLKEVIPHAGNATRIPATSFDLFQSVFSAT